MANYQSAYTGPEIDAAVDKANNAILFDRIQLPGLTDQQKIYAQTNMGIRTWAADIERFQNTRKNTYNVKTDTLQSGYLDETGLFISDSSYRTTDYVPVTAGQVVTYRLSQNLGSTDTPMPILAYYTTGKWYIPNNSVVSNVQDYIPAMSYDPATWTAPADGYVRFVYYVGKPDIFANFTSIIPSNVEDAIRTALAPIQAKLQSLPDLPNPLQEGIYKILVSGQQMSLIMDTDIPSAESNSF